MTKTVQSNCHYCGYLCGFYATVEDTPDGQRLVDLSPDPSRYPYDENIINGCKRWKMNLTEIDGPERINYPLRRVGERGSGQWQRVGWDEALDDIAKQLSKLAEQHGPQTLATAIGGPHGAYWPLHRFMNLWGSPNNMGIGQICWNIRIWMDALAYGWPIEVNIDPGVSEQVFLWGTNPAQSDNSLFWRTLLQMRKAGTPLVVIDPRKTGTARIASLHLAPRPGSDCTLALAIIRWIIKANRYSHEFVQRWCHGFDELVAHVEPYTLEQAEQVTGVAAADIEAAAELFSRSGPSALLSGRGVDQLGPNTAPTHRALSILRAITGDVDRPGACYIMDSSDFIPEVDLEMSDALTPEARATQLNEGFSALQSYSGYTAATALTSRLGRTAANPLGKRLPMRYLASAHPNLVWRAALGEWPACHSDRAAVSSDEESLPNATPPCHSEMSSEAAPPCHSEMSSEAAIEESSPGTKPLPATEAPYRITALICMAANPLVTYADTKLVYRALKSLELLVVLEYYMTPTAQLADYVLPSAGAFERPQYQAHGGVSNFAYGGAAAVEPYYERHTDYDFFRGLGLRVGQEQYWPSATLKDAIEATMQVAGVSWQQWTQHGIYYNRMVFSKQEILDENSQPQGFATTTGKLELANELLEQLGSTRLPVPVVSEMWTDGRVICAPLKKKV
jgi:anaerobic selenocysteine-containing dehydrogenase